MKKIKPGEPFQMGNQIWEYSLTKEGAVAIKVLKELPKKEDKIFVPPSLEEVIAFFKENSMSAYGAEQAFKYYNEAEPPWTDGRGTPVRSWKSKMRVNWFRDQYRVVEVAKSNTSDPTNGVIM